jgi:hypothetical protein
LLRKNKTNTLILSMRLRTVWSLYKGDRFAVARIVSGGLGALPLDGVGLAPFGGGAQRWSGRSVWIFLALALSLRKPPLIGFDCLGFPWILSSESILFNGLHGIKRGNFFLAPFPGVRNA